MIEYSFDDMVKNSFADWHAIGLNYLCLYRDDLFTHKVYFLPDTASAYVVSPHNHRFNFEMHVLRGTLAHVTFQFSSYNNRNPNDDRPWQRFSHVSPHVGGPGFQWMSPAHRASSNLDILKVGQRRFVWHDEVHTLYAHDSDPVILEQFQYRDIVPPSIPTELFQRGTSKLPPTLEGLYNKPSRNEVSDWLDQYIAIRGPLDGLDFSKSSMSSQPETLPEMVELPF